MAFEARKFSRTQVDRAGALFRQSSPDPSALQEAQNILGNWRAAHAFPLNTIAMDLLQKLRRLDQRQMPVRRLKRAPSIVAKLRSKKSMRLTQMQDIGGCRAVLSSMEQLGDIRSLFENSRSRHQFVDEIDYVAKPRKTGYRSIHRVYRFQGRQPGAYDGLLIEVQLRTRLQHAWATAVETVGAILGQDLKAGDGEQPWLDLFRDSAAAFAFLEKANRVPGTPQRPGQLARDVSKKLKDLGVRARLSAYRKTLQVTSSKSAKDAAYFVLELRPDKGRLRVHPFTRHQLQAAYALLGSLESTLMLPEVGKQAVLFSGMAETIGPQFVLVGAASLKAVRASYPNYYADTDFFVTQLGQFVERFRHWR